MAARIMPAPSIATFDAIAASTIPQMRNVAKASHRAGLQRIVYGGVRQSRSVREFFIVILHLFARLTGAVAALALHLLGVAGLAFKAAVIVDVGDHPTPEAGGALI
jgi:hypothetical protein